MATIGGLSVGETHKEMIDVIKSTVKYLDIEKPRYVMGIGRPVDIISAVEQGMTCLIVFYLQDLEEMEEHLHLMEK